MSPTKIIFIDYRVADYEAIIEKMATLYEIYLLTAESDGIEQITEHLTGRTGLDSIHLISHGSKGTLYLGSSILNSSNLAPYEVELSRIGSALSEFGDIFLYGCNVAQDDVGFEFLTLLSQATNADIAANISTISLSTLNESNGLQANVGSIDSPPLAIENSTGFLGANTRPTFTASDGIVTTYFGSSRERATDIAVLPDGKILAVGWSLSSTRSVIVRYNSDGTIDSTFGTEGIVTVSGAFAKNVAIQEDGKIVLCGDSGSGKLVLSRFNSNGTPDLSFGTNGTVLSTDYSGSALAIQLDGTILVAGNSLHESNSDYAILKFKPNGTLDTSFNSTGVAIASFGPAYSQSAGIATQADGKILVAGSVKNSVTEINSFGIVRLNADGSLDTSFDLDGKLTTSFTSNWSSAASIKLQSDGKILVAGTTSNQPAGYGGGELFALARYNNDGSLDTSFNGSGKVMTTITTYNSSANDVTIQSDGKILVSGWAYNGSNANAFSVARYNSDGSLDSTFDGDGKVITSIGSVGSFSFSLAIQPDSRFLLAGYHYGTDANNQIFDVVRYNSDGSLDHTFSIPENTLINSAAYTENRASIILEPKIQIFDSELSLVGNYNGAFLSLSRHGGANSQDTFSSASNTLTSLTSGSYFGVDGVTIGRVTVNSAGTLTLAFNANATQSLVNKAMQQIAYANSSDSPPASVQIDWVFNDGNSGAQGAGGSLSVTGSTTVQITAVNDDPFLLVSIPDLFIKAQSSLNYTVPDGTFFDRDGDALTWSMVLADGTAAPPWLTFNKTTKTLSGTPSSLDEGTISLRITATDPSGSSSSDIVNITVKPASQSLSGHVYHWMSHKLIPDVNVTAEQQTSATNSAGEFLVDVVSKSATGVTATRETTTLEMGNVISSADALAALKIAVGRSPNADGSPASPYQLIAADVNNDGKVTSADALMILKMAVKRPEALSREWVFVNESQDFWDESANNGQGAYTINRTNVTWNKDLQITVSQDTTMNLLAVLKGDVNGNWTGPTSGTQSLPNSYFSDPMKKGLGPLSTWGVVAA